MGIQVISAPNKTNAGQFNLPVEFDNRVYAAQWAEEGHEQEFFQQRQPIVGTRLDSDGWGVWKDPKTKQPRRAKTANGKTYVLMFRDRKLQDEVNAIYGDVSKASAYQPQSREAITSEAGQRMPGMLTEEDLQKLEGGSSDDSSNLIPAMNSPHSQKAGVLSKSQSTKE